MQAQRGINLQVCVILVLYDYTINREIFVVEIFSYSMLCTKIKHMKLKHIRNINVNVHGKG